jgi:hypothetical protein
MRGSVHSHGHRVTRLHEDSSRPSKLAHEAFTCGQVADNSTGRNTLERVFAIPRDQMSVVDDVLFAFAELEIMERLVICLVARHRK